MMIVILNPYEFLQDEIFIECKIIVYFLISSSIDNLMTKSGSLNSANEILTVLSLLKTYFFLRTFMYFSRFNDPRA